MGINANYAKMNRKQETRNAEYKSLTGLLKR